MSAAFESGFVGQEGKILGTLSRRPSFSSLPLTLSRHIKIAQRHPTPSAHSTTTSSDWSYPLQDNDGQVVRTGIQATALVSGCRRQTPRSVNRHRRTVAVALAGPTRLSTVGRDASPLGDRERRSSPLSPGVPARRRADQRDISPSRPNPYELTCTSPPVPCSYTAVLQGAISLTPPLNLTD